MSQTSCSRKKPQVEEHKHTHITLSIVMKGQLANETVNYDTKPCSNLSQKCNLQRPTLQVKEQKQSFAFRWKNRKFRKLHRKTSVFESLSNKVAGLSACNSVTKRLQYRFFPAKFTKFLKTSFLQNSYNGCFWVLTRILKGSGTKTDATVSNTYQI